MGVNLATPSVTPGSATARTATPAWTSARARWRWSRVARRGRLPLPGRVGEPACSHAVVAQVGVLVNDAALPAAHDGLRRLRTTSGRAPWTSAAAPRACHGPSRQSAAARDKGIKRRNRHVRGVTKASVLNPMPARRSLGYQGGCGQPHGGFGPMPRGQEHPGESRSPRPDPERRSFRPPWGA